MSTSETARAILWESLGDIPESYIMDAMPPSWREDGAVASKRRGVAKRQRTREGLGRLFDSGWTAAVLSALVAVGVIVALVLAGRTGPDVPVGTEPNETEAVSDTEPTTDVPESETEAGLRPTQNSTNPYDHPVDARVPFTVKADGETYNLNRGYLYSGYLTVESDEAGEVSGEHDFDFPPIDAYYLSLLAEDPDMATVYVSAGSALSWSVNWNGVDKVGYGVEAIYDGQFKKMSTGSKQLTDGVYYFVFKLDVEGGRHRVGDIVYTLEGGRGYAHYQIPCRVVIGDADFTPPTKKPTPPADTNDVQSEFRANCFVSNGDGTCSFTLRGYQQEKILQIPAQSPEGEPVTVIQSCRPGELGTTVILPDSVIEIADRAFARCAGLREVIFGKGLRQIGEEAFRESRSLVSVTMQDGVESIGASAFSSCSRLKEIHLPDSLVTLGEDAFRGCSALAEVTLSERLTVIAVTTFRDCRSLVRVTVPSSVAEIGREAFAGCEALGEVVLSDGVQHIGEGAFRRCHALSEVVMPDSVTAIDKCAFEYCESLSTLRLSEGLQELGTYVFAGSGLTSLTLPSGLTAIPDGTFDNCLYLTDFDFPAHITEIGSYAFENTGIVSLTLPETVKHIGATAFSRCAGLQTVQIKGATVIEPNAFSLCDRLETVTLNEGLLTLGDRAFADCPLLGAVKLPASITDMGDAVFANSGTGAESD